jgi:hypothetical protein
MNRKVYLVLGLTVLLLAGGFRFHRIGERSLWLDEARIANYARQSLVDNITKTRLGSSSPVAFPLILQAVQRVDDSPFAARSTAAVFSLLAIVALLALPSFGFDRGAALVSASILAVSPTQVRYAQEVREYSLSVLLASLSVLALVAVIRQRKSARLLIVSVAFLAPLAQYGLVLLVVALVLTVLLEARGRDARETALRTAALATTALIAASAVSYLLTLRGQLGYEMRYMDSAYFHGSLSDLGALCSFLASRGLQLSGYLTFGSAAVVAVLLIVGCVLLSRPSAPRDARLVCVFAVTSVAIIAIASVAGVYPFGPIRQNLFLAPLVASTLGAAWWALYAAFPERMRSVATVASIAAILAAGSIAIVRANPYKEVEDIKSILEALERRQPGDIVYVHDGSRPAMRYYRVDGPEFVFGTGHRRDPEASLPEFRRLVGDDASRVWLVFTHAGRSERSRFLKGLNREWNFTPVVKANGARLYLGRRIANGPREPTNNGPEKPNRPLPDRNNQPISVSAPG